MAVDRYTKSLQCSKCGKHGTARYRENDIPSWWNTRNRSVVVPAGFLIINHGRDHGEETIIQCDCGNVVVGE